MAIGTTTVLTQDHSGTDATSYATASVSPTAGAVLTLIVLSGRTDGTAGAVTGVSGLADGSGWSEVAHQISGIGNIHISVWQCLAAGSSGTATASFAGTQMNAHWTLLQTTGAALSTNFASSTGVSTATVTLPSAPASSSEIIGAYGVNSGSQYPTVFGAGFVELGTATTDSSPSSIATSERRTGTTSTTVDLTPAGTSQNVLIGLEIPEASTPAPVASKEITQTKTTPNSGSATADTSIDYGASSDTTSVSVDSVSGGGLVVGDITVTSLVLSFTDDPARTDNVVIDVTLTGAGGTTADTVTVPPLGTIIGGPLFGDGAGGWA